MIQEQPESIDAFVSRLQSVRWIADDPVQSSFKLRVVPPHLSLAPVLLYARRQGIIERTLATKGFKHNIAVRQRRQSNQIGRKRTRRLMKQICLHFFSVWKIMLWTIALFLWGCWVVYWFLCLFYRIAEDDDECR